MPPGRATGSIAYSSTGFRRFLDNLTRYGLEYFGLYYGVYRAEIISNEDPLSKGNPDPLGRLTIVVPSIDGPSRLTTRVAYPIAPIAGPGYGFKSLPPVGGHVLVEFERGRADLPMWKGGWWGTGDLPEDIQHTDSHGWITPQGHQIIMDDQSGSEFIRVKHKNGSCLVEFDSDGAISITNTSGQKVNIGDGAATANEPAVLGTTLKSLLDELLDALTALTVPTGAGPSGTPVNFAQFVSIKARLQTALSSTVQVK